MERLSLTVLMNSQASGKQVGWMKCAGILENVQPQTCIPDSRGKL